MRVLPEAGTAGPATRAEIAALRVVLLVLGVLMVLGGRFSARFRRQVTRDLVFTLSAEDGPSRYYELHARTRTLTLPRHPGRPVDCALRFPSSREALLTLLSPKAIGRIVDGMNTGHTEIDGNAVLMLWFYGLTRVVLPIGRSRLPKRPIPAPERTPETRAAYAERITREPAVTELDRAWEAGWRGRNKLLHARGAEGEPLPPG